MKRWIDVWTDWCGAHPVTLLYIVVIGIVNVILNVLELILR